jgi:hypothetical protein
LNRKDNFGYLDILDNKKKELASQSPLWISEELEWWHERSNDSVPRFIQIASLYSELIAVSASGQLYQWKWTEHEPYKNAEVLLNILIAHFYEIYLFIFLYRTQMCIIQEPFLWH